MKRILALILILVLSFTTLGMSANATTEEIPSNIQLLNALGIIKGFPDNTLHLNDNLTRAEAATIILRITHLNADTLEKSKLDPAFADTKDHWGNSAIYYAKLEGSINGHSETEFAPDDKLTVVQALKILIAKVNHVTLTGDDWAAKTLANAALYEIVPINPNANITRGQFAEYIYIIAYHDIAQTYALTNQIYYDKIGVPTYRYFVGTKELANAPIASLKSFNLDLRKTIKQQIEDLKITYDYQKKIPLYINTSFIKDATINTLLNYYNSWCTITIYYEDTTLISAAILKYDFAQINSIDNRTGYVRFTTLDAQPTALVDVSGNSLSTAFRAGDYFLVAYIKNTTTNSECEILDCITVDYYRGEFVPFAQDLSTHSITILTSRVYQITFSLGEYPTTILNDYLRGDLISIITYGDTVLRITNETLEARIKAEEEKKLNDKEKEDAYVTSVSTSMLYITQDISDAAGEISRTKISENTSLPTSIEGAIDFAAAKIDAILRKYDKDYADKFLTAMEIKQDGADQYLSLVITHPKTAVKLSYEIIWTLYPEDDTIKIRAIRV